MMRFGESRTPKSGELQIKIRARVRESAFALRSPATLVTKDNAKNFLYKDSPF
jgi:hypothetical protein